MQNALGNTTIDMQFGPVFQSLAKRSLVQAGDTIQCYELDANVIPTTQGNVARQSAASSRHATVTPDGHKIGWKTYNFEVAEHHTYVADGVRVHNMSTEYTLNDDGTIATLTAPDDSPIAVQGSWTPGQAYHYGQIVDVENDDGTTTPTLTTGGFWEGLSAFGRSFADAIGLDGRVGYQDTFAQPQEGLAGPFHEVGQPTPYRVDWSGDQDGDGINDAVDSDYSNIGHWGGDRDGDGVPNWQDHNDGVGWRDNNPGGEGNSDGNGKPIILDMDGDGIEIDVGGSVFFDMDADGYLESTAWVSPDDAFLVIDLNADGSRGAGDGQINMTQELAFSEWLPTGGVTDLQALSMFDTLAELGGNGDGVISAADTVFNELRVWQDLDQDGEVDDGELKTLTQVGITQINLTYDDGTAYDDNRNDVSVFGSTLLGTASYMRDGAVVEGGVGDVALAYDTLGYRRVETAEGYMIDFEVGEDLNYRELDGTGSANADLFAGDFDGVFGDARDNQLDASAAEKAVQISGGDGADTLVGSAQDDWIDGGDGADSLVGGDGNDVLFVDADDLLTGFVHGGSGVDTAIVTSDLGVSLNLGSASVENAIGGDGNDYIGGGTYFYDLTVQGRGGHDTLGGANSDDVISGDEGNDELHGGAGSDLLIGGSGGDVLYGGAGDDLLLGGADADYIDGGLGDDVIDGGDGADGLTGGAGDDIIAGGAGNDVIVAGEGDNRVDGGTGDDVAHGGYGDEVFYGGAGNDTLLPGHGDDFVSGGAGNDDFQIAGDGQNYIFGGTGYDEAFFSGYSNYSVAEVEQPGHGRIFLVQGMNGSGGWGMASILKDVERVVLDNGQTFTAITSDVDPENLVRFSFTALNLTVHGTWGGHDLIGGGAFNDTLSGASGNDIEYGHGGNDELHGWTGTDLLFAGSGNDTIYAQQDGDVAYGAGGQDSIYGGDGNDAIYGESGADQLFGETGNDVIYGQGGADTLAGGHGTDHLQGDDGNDVIKGGADGDVILGGEGEDLLYGDSGNDNLNGGNSSDRLYGGTGGDILDGGLGRDWLYGGHGVDQLIGNYGDDVLYGQSGGDVILGNQGRDALFGGGDNDNLAGGDDDDWLDGGYGNDILTGEAGADVLIAGTDLGVWNPELWALSMGGISQNMKWLVGDFDGDGIEDFAKTFTDGGLASLDTHISTGSGFGISRWATQQGGFWDTQKWLSGDFNNDGKTDVMKVFADAGLASLDVHLSTGSSFGIARWATQQGSFSDTQKWLSGDFDGDDIDDVVNIFADANLASIDVHLSDGIGSFGITRWNTQQGGFWDQQNWLSGDFDGDGIDDIMKVWTDSNTALTHADVHISNGSSFGMSRWLNVEDNDLVEEVWKAADVNGDGRDDLIKIARGQSAESYVRIYLSEGDGFSNDVWSQQISTYHLWQTLVMGDFTGNGQAEVAQLWDHAGLSVVTHSLVAGSNSLDGGTGNDLLISHGGNDVLTGGDGADTFRFVGNFGVNEITDFDATGNYEAIEFVDVAGLSDFADLSANHLTQVGADTHIDDLLGNLVILKDVNLTSLTEDDFIFL